MEQKTVSQVSSSEKQKRKGPVLRIFTIFFHPNSVVTAMGGAEKRFVETLKFFNKKGNLEITVLESAPSLLADASIVCKTCSLRSSLHGKGWLSTYVSWILWIARASVKSLSLAHVARPSVVFVPNNTLPNLISGYTASRILGLPLCVVTHHIDVPPLRVSGLKNHSIYGCYRSIEYSRPVSLVKTLAFYTMLSLLKKSNTIITVSNFTAEALKQNGVSKTKIHVSGNAIDANLAQNINSQTSKKTYHAIFVGRIAKEKGVFDLLKVWKEIAKVRKDAKLLLVGSGLELPCVKEKIATSGLENNVLLRGSCSDKELHNLLNSSRIFIFPSLFEGWGLAVAEALACGLPVVAYDIPALKEVFGNCKSVFLVPVKNFESMTSTVLDILDAGEEELHELSYCSKTFSRQFNWENVAEKDLEIIRTFENTQ
jgi:glycosyltransferase involved in cell wall biosynthesis